MESYILSNISIDEIVERITTNVVEKIKEVSINATPVVEEDPILTRKETATILQISLVSLHKWTKEGKIKALKISGRVRYKKSDVLKSLKVIEFQK